MKISVFLPAFNVATQIGRLLAEMNDVFNVFGGQGHELCVLVIDDHSIDATAQALQEAGERYSWLQIRTNPQNLGNATNILAGYRWGVEQESNLIACMDADGEHSPYSLIRHARMILDGVCDGVVGSIIFPDHNSNYHDRNMMRFWGGMQASLAGIDGMFYIQSPGYNVHQGHRVAMALQLFEEYQIFFAAHTTEEFPRWGVHGVIIHLVARGTGANVKAAYLECFGQSPNRTPEKLLLQANAANIHSGMLARFLPKK